MAPTPDPLHRPGLIADIGGTNARFALSEADGSVRDAVGLACRDFPERAAAAEAFPARIAPPATRRRPEAGDGRTTTRAAKPCCGSLAVQTLAQTTQPNQAGHRFPRLWNTRACALIL